MATIFNIDFSELSRARFLDFIRLRIQQRRPCYVVTPNLHFARLAAENENFRAALETAELRLCDSAVLTRMLALRGAPLPARLTGSDLTPELLRIAEEKGWRVFLFGSDRETLDRVRAKFPRAICGVASPPVCDRPWDLDELNDEYLCQIKAVRPDLMFVALGVRKQEYWARKYFARSEVPVTLCVGASLDFIGERIRRAPKFFSRIGMEWFWRLSVEPARLWRRYSGDAVFLLKFGMCEIFKGGERRPLKDGSAVFWKSSVARHRGRWFKELTSLKNRNWLLIDGNYQRLGGVESLNIATIRSLAGALFVRRCDLKNVFSEILGQRPEVVIVDLPLTWRRIPTLILLRAFCSLGCSEGISLALREHNYSRSFEKEAVRHRRRFRCLLRLGYGLMDRVIFVSDAQAEWARECGFCTSDKIGIAEHAVEIEDLLILQKVPPSGTIVFGALARMTVQKGLDVLLEAWKMSGVNGQAKLIIGGEGPEEEKLRKYASELEAVEFLGPVTDRKAFYERCHCIVIPSRWEPFGQVCLEARAAGCPVIVSDVDGLPEQLDSGMCGLLFRSRDIFDLASKMEQMCEMVRVPEQFQRMCLAGRTSSARTRERFLKEFTKLLEPAETYRGSGEA